MNGEAFRAALQRAQTFRVDSIHEWPTAGMNLEDTMDAHDVLRAFDRLAESEQEACERDILVQKAAEINPFIKMWGALSDFSTHFSVRYC